MFGDNVNIIYIFSTKNNKMKLTEEQIEQISLILGGKLKQTAPFGHSTEYLFSTESMIISFPRLTEIKAILPNEFDLIMAYSDPITKYIEISIILCE